jgi:hypothetical protein
MTLTWIDFFLIDTTDFGRETQATITATDTTTRRHDYDSNNPRYNCGKIREKTRE